MKSEMQILCFYIVQQSYTVVSLNVNIQFANLTTILQMNLQEIICTQALCHLRLHSIALKKYFWRSLWEG